MVTKKVEFEGFSATFGVSQNVCDVCKLPRLIHPADLSKEFCERCDRLEINTIVAQQGEEKQDSTAAVVEEVPLAVEPQTAKKKEGGTSEEGEEKGTSYSKY